MDFISYNSRREALALVDPIRTKTPSVFDALQDCNCYIAGGAITSVFTGSKINDYDIYFPSYSHGMTGETLNDMEHFMHAMNLFIDEKPSKIYSTDFAITYVVNGLTFQVIKLYTEMWNIRDIMSKFDFTCCMGAYSPQYFTRYGENSVFDDEFILGSKFLQHNAQKRLVFNIDSDYPLASFLRSKKYMSRGYDFSGLEMLKLVLKCNSIDLTNYADLRKHILGIDTLILKDLTDAIAADENVSNKKYDFNEAIAYIDDYLTKKGCYFDF